MKAVQLDTERCWTHLCCSHFPWQLGVSAQNMMEAFQDLVAGRGVKDCNKDNTESKVGSVPSVASSMPAKYYGDSKLPGYVTFAAFYQPDIPNDTTPPFGGSGPDRFRVIWNGEPGAFRYYGGGAPEPIVFPPGPLPNDVYAFRLIVTREYQSTDMTPKDFTSLIEVPGIMPTDIARIEGVYLESSEGYIARHEEASYNDVLSSKGVVVRLRLKNSRETVLCYLINNYNGNAPLIWKQKNAGLA